MKDQAERLRQMMKKNDLAKSPVNRKAKVIAVTSGKGGVGKTNFAINLAISIKRLGYKVLIIDADLGLANIEILTGTNIRYTITDLIVGGKDIKDIICAGPEDIKLISGGIGEQELLAMNDESIKKMIFEIEKLEYMIDYIIIDTGAGIANTVIDFVMAANEAVLVTTPDPTSIMDGYTMIKALTGNGYEGKLNIVTNIVRNRKEAMDTFSKLNKASDSFLKIKINFLGYLEKDDIVIDSVKNQTPFLLKHPKSDLSKRMNIMALKFINDGKDTHIKQKPSFAQRLKQLLFRRGG